MSASRYIGKHGVRPSRNFMEARGQTESRVQVSRYVEPRGQTCLQVSDSNLDLNLL
jgi:hypothetical protein